MRILSLRPPIAGPVLLLAVMLAAVAPAAAQPAPPSLDEALAAQLAFGESDGCVALLRLQPGNPAAVDDTLRVLAGSGEIGNELRAICGPSAVNSASSLGGALNTLQATKTVTQFRLVRRRIDQRIEQQRRPVTPPGRPDPPRDRLQAVLQQPAPTTVTTGADLAAGAGIFGEIELGTRDRVATSYESGFTSDLRSLAIGVDYAAGAGVVGGWIGRARQDAAFLAPATILPPLSLAGADTIALLQQPGVLPAVCGGATDPGSFEDRATRLGAFGGLTLGLRGFVDGSVMLAWRDHAYARDICAIELASGELSFQPDVVFDDANGNGFVNPGEIVTAPGQGILFGDTDNISGPTTGDTVVDDVFAGTLAGSTTARDTAVSVRAGTDLEAGAWIVGPRVVFTYARAEMAAYVESGVSTVATTVVSNFQTAVPRTLGGPIGLELAYDEQTWRSLLLEAGGEVGYRIPTGFGAVVPHGGGYWRREFEDDLRLVTVHFAQDLRPAPTSFSFGTDGPDSTSALFFVGGTVLAADRFSARVEFSTTAWDALFDDRLLSIQARWRF